MDATTDADRPALIINADDFGLSEGINRGIIEALAARALTSTSVMVSMPAFSDAARRARAFGDALGVGLHFTLTVGRPLTRAASLVDAAGNFLSLPALAVRALTDRVRRRDVADECAAQIALARDAGFRLTHLDGHHHVHLLPGIRAAVRDVVQAERVPAVRRPLERLVGVPNWWRRLPERALLRALAREVDRQRWNVVTADHFVGSSLLGARNFHDALVRTIVSLRRGTTELMVHPGYVPESLPGNDAYTTQREVELRALTSPDVIALLHSGRIRLTHFGRLEPAI